jgi:hypothetical protein
VAPIIVPQQPSPSGSAAEPGPVPPAAASGSAVAASGTDAAPVCPENAIGDLEACKRWKVDPTCESADSTPRMCTGLMDYGQHDGEGFQPRVAAMVAACMVKVPNVKPACRYPDMHRCIRDAVDLVCVEPAMVAACERAVAECHGRGATPTFTVAQCAKIASATRGRMREWALRVMSGHYPAGQIDPDGCNLQAVTVYQPWPKNWWTGK